MLEMRAKIFGNVQGIGFRATTKKFADQLKLTGYVRNNLEGAVEICAHGGRKELELLILKLQGAFDPDAIAGIETDFHTSKNHFSQFSILR